MKRDALPLTAAAPPARRVFPTIRQLWFQLHWFIGITAGTVLVVIGITGALLAFRDELTDLLNPGVRQVAAQAGPMLTPQQAASAVRSAHPDRRVTSVIVYAAPGSAVRVGLAPLPGEPRGETLYVHPYSGSLQPELRGDGVFEWIEYLHRWLLLPRDAGRPVVGTLALCLLGLALSGLYLRWPRRAGDWRAWLKVDTRLTGRPFLWALHSVAGTWALAAYVIFTATGAYWSFDILRDTVDGWAGVQRPAAKAMKAHAAGKKAPPVDLGPAWSTFLQQAPDWQMASLRFTDKPKDPVQVAWLAPDAPHPRARSKMNIAPDGTLVKNEPYGAQSTAARALTTIYPLHMGTYFGLPGRIAMLLASLALPGFAVTGWMLYLQRRRQARATRAERARLAGEGAPVPLAGREPVLVAYASQTGQAERWALHTAAGLQAAGMPAHVRSLATLVPNDLAAYRHALFVASSHGDGEPPDSARRFARLLADTTAALDLRHAVLALGDRGYARFCGFGHALEGRLAALGSRPLFAPVEVDNGDATALARWSAALACLGVAPLDLAAADASPLQTFTLARRTLLNPGSVGAPLYEIALAGIGDWQAGALLEVLVPGPDGAPAAPRRYSVASVPADGTVELLVRQVRHAGGLGVASGWLTAQAPPGAAVTARLLPNPAFAPVPDDVPCIFIGNGSGLAGLRSHLRARVAAGLRRNWLLFGERHRAHDSLCAAELAQWSRDGFLPQRDLVFSRDGDGYVQDRLRSQGDLLRGWIAEGAVVFICGSLQGMAGGVEAALVDLLGQTGIDDLTAAGRLRRDVY